MKGNHRRMKLPGSLLAVFFLFISSCATTPTVITGSWKDEAFQGQFRKIAVIGVSKRVTLRNSYEDEFVRELKARGNEAIQSYTFLSISQIADKETAAAKLKDAGADAVIVTRLVDKKTIQTYAPGRTYAVPNHYYSWGSYYRYAYTPGYIIDDEYACLETNLYDIRSEKLIWSALSETEMIGANQELVRSFVQVMIGKLASDGMVK